MGELTGRRGVEKAVSHFSAGGAVVVWDPERKGEGDVIAAGVDLRPETPVFFLTQARGHTTVPCDLERLERLEIPQMPGQGDRHGTAPHVSVDLVPSTGTGVSAHERAATIRPLRIWTRVRRTSCVPATSSRCTEERADYASGPVTPKRL